MERRGARHHGQKKKFAKLSSDVAGSHCELRRRRQKAPWTDVDKLFGCALQIFHKNRQAGHRIPSSGICQSWPHSFSTICKRSFHLRFFTRLSLQFCMMDMGASYLALATIICKKKLQDGSVAGPKQLKRIDK